MLTLGVSTLDAQAATKDHSKSQNIQQLKSQIPCINQIDNPKKMEDCLQSMLNGQIKINSILSQQKDCVDSNQQKEETSEPVQSDTSQPSTEKESIKDTKENLIQFEQQVVELTNIERKKQGLPELQVDMNLSKVAHLKSEDMQKNHYFDHNSPTYGSPFDMMRNFGISYSAAGENIAQGQRTPEKVIQAWMDSPGHRANILNPSYTHVGVGYVENGNYWTQEFISK